MKSLCIQTFLVFALSLLVNARLQTRVRSGTSTQGAGNDWATSGNYLIYSCSSQAPDVKFLLNSTNQFLQAAITSTFTPAYEAFFRSTTPTIVENVFRAITTGTDITTIRHGRRRPTLVCVNTHDPGLTTFVDLCDSQSGPTVIQPQGTSLVFLCPAFFKKPVAPPSQPCGVVNSDGTQLTTQPDIRNQFGLLVQALADMYIRETNPGLVTLRGSPNQNDCLALPSGQSLRNPASYVYYAWNARRGCNEFPEEIPLRPQRELTEVGDGNGTQLVTVGCEGNSVSCYS